DVDVADAVLICRFGAEDATAEITEEGLINANVVADANVNSADALKILKFVARIISEEALAP
ncbi:MAG TPA: hypothetical protein DCG49_07015, partial [Ruminococcus sp.]|nr:hypothetical protein [Ruminococcus sp.]